VGREFEWQWRGRRCLWRHTPRGGYGFVIRVPVTIVAITSRTRATVLVESVGKRVSVSRRSLVDPQTPAAVWDRVHVEAGR
jgi:hypothetical protein